MKSAKEYAVVVCILSLSLAGGARAEVTVSGVVDTSRDIYAGDRFGFSVVIEGDNKAGEVDLGPLAEFDPQSGGNQDVSQTSISIINGRTEQSVVKRYVMNYSLTAKKTGKITIPSVSARVDGREYKTQPIVINVVEPGQTDKLAVEMELSEERCYAGQPVVLTLRAYFAGDIQGPTFVVPVLRDAGFELDDVDAGGGQLREYDLGVGATVLGRQYQTSRGGRAFNVLEAKKVLIPKRSGVINIEAASFSANLPVGQRRTMSIFDSGYEYERFMVSSEGGTLTVSALPEEGKPKEFYGLVGRYEISAAASPVQVNVGDPITLTIRIGGSEYMKAVQWPALEAVEELAANFKIPAQKASPEVAAGAKVFTQTIRANSDKVTRIPGIPLAFFDPDKGKYAVVESEPIAIEVAPTKVLTSADLEGSESAPVNREVEAIKRGLSANYESLDVLENMEFSPAAASFEPLYAAIWGLPLLALTASCVLKVVTQTSPEKTAARVRRQACGKAQKALKKAASVKESERHLLVAEAMKQYIGERLGRNAASLTAVDCYESVVCAAGDEGLAARYRDVVEQCERGRYAGDGVEVGPETLREVSELIRTIDKKSGK